jgi:hypothetical protein
VWLITPAASPDAANAASTAAWIVTVKLLDGTSLTTKLLRAYSVPLAAVPCALCAGVSSGYTSSAIDTLAHIQLRPTLGYLPQAKVGCGERCLRTASIACRWSENFKYVWLVSRYISLVDAVVYGKLGPSKVPGLTSRVCENARHGRIRSTASGESRFSIVRLPHEDLRNRGPASGLCPGLQDIAT